LRGSTEVRDFATRQINKRIARTREKPPMPAVAVATAAAAVVAAAAAVPIPHVRQNAPVLVLFKLPEVDEHDVRVGVPVL